MTPKLNLSKAFVTDIRLNDYLFNKEKGEIYKVLKYDNYFSLCRLGEGCYFELQRIDADEEFTKDHLYILTEGLVENRYRGILKIEINIEIDDNPGF